MLENHRRPFLHQHVLQLFFQLSPTFLFTFFLSKQPSEVFGFVVVGFAVGFVGFGSTPAQSLLPDTTFLSAFEYPYPDMVQHPYDQCPAFPCAHIQYLQSGLCLQRALQAVMVITFLVILTSFRCWRLTLWFGHGRVGFGLVVDGVGSVIIIGPVGFVGRGSTWVVGFVVISVISIGPVGFVGKIIQAWLVGWQENIPSPSQWQS